MKYVALDFSASPPAAIRIGRWLAAIVLVGGLVIAAMWAQRYLELRNDLDEWRDSFQRVERRRVGESQRPPGESAQRLKAELKRANRVIESLATPWQDLLNATEGALSEQATLLGIDPDAERREVRLTGEAKDLPAMLGYLKALRQSPVLLDAVLSSHQINVKDAQRPVRFVIVAHWFDMPPVEQKDAAMQVSAETDP